MLPCTYGVKVGIESILPSASLRKLQLIVSCMENRFSYCHIFNAGGRLVIAGSQENVEQIASHQKKALVECRLDHLSVRTIRCGT